MLSLSLKNGEYLTIGEDIVIQVFTNSTIQVHVTAPKDRAILRGEVLERNGEKRPANLFEPKAKQKKAKQPRLLRGRAPDENLFSNG